MKPFRWILILFIAFLSFTHLHATDRKIVVNNRVLAKVNGKAISVIDVMKKMDMLFYRQYPQFINSSEARYQYYLANWKRVLSDLIDRELVIADAEEKAFEVSQGDIREEMEEIFGPNVMLNLDSVGLTMDEAWDMVKADILIRRMLYMQVKSRIFPLITPKELWKGYQEHVRNIEGEEEWVWCALTIKANESKKSKEIADIAYKALTSENANFDTITKALEDKKIDITTVDVRVSPIYRQKKSELAPNLIELFSRIDLNSYSAPLKQTSRSDGTESMRIYTLLERTKQDPPSFQEMETQLRDDISQKLSNEETLAYFDRLRAHFDVAREGIEEKLHQDFRPFDLS